jgi:peptide/nickel transport system substrate-binding protein
MKKVLSLVVIAILALSMSACQTAAPEGTVIVGTPAMNGDFVAGFGNNSYDLSVRRLIGEGLETYAVNQNGEFVLNPTVVKDLATSEDNEGNKTYTFELQKNLKWNDGEPVTAKDYVFGILFAASPAWREAGASSTAGQNLVGYEAYNDGDSDVFEGIELVDDHTFSLTIAAENLPYFYEVAWVAYGATPLHVWGADLELAADGKSVTGDLTAAAEKVATSERFAPTVTAGMYKFVSYENDTVTLVYNENYPGDFRGHQPKVANVIVRYINQTLDVDLVISGDVDIVAGVIEGAKIEKARASDQADLISYKRNGYGMIAFTNDFGPTQYPEVRKALAFLIDRNEFLINILGGYGAVTNGEFGLAQWMYVAKAAEIEETLENFTLNVDKANELLDQSPYVFEADGVTPWDVDKAEAGYWRHDAEGTRLKIEHFGTIDNEITDLIGAKWPEAMQFAGIDFDVTYGDFNALLNNYYYGYDLGDDRKFHSFNLATGFADAYDPYYSLHSDFLGTWMNATGTNDPEFDRLIERMRNLDPEQRDEYLEAWFDYQVYWNEMLPVLPIYSNEYFDVFNKRVSGLNTTPFYGWARAMVDVEVSD